MAGVACVAVGIEGEEERGGNGKMRGRSKEDNLESMLLDKVGEVASAVGAARCVDDVVCALHSLAVLLFPVDSVLVAGCLDERCRSQVLGAGVSIEVERDECRRAFYKGAAFPTMARILLYNVASNWLACFPSSAQIQVYDSFFLKGSPADTLQALIFNITGNGCGNDVDRDSVFSNIERLLVLSLMKNNGVYTMAVEFGDISSKESTYKFSTKNDFTFVSRMAQLLASVPDKSRPAAPAALSSHLFFKHIGIQLLAAAGERAERLHGRRDTMDKATINGTFSFVSETFERICRRGSADVLLLVIIPRIVDHVRSCFSSTCNSHASNFIESRSESVFWFLVMENIKDSYVVDRLSEQLLHQLSIQNITDEEAYWILWTLFHRTFHNQAATRGIFCEKFLLCKVFPLRCLKWILQFSVLGCPPSVSTEKTSQNRQRVLDIVQRMIGIWSKREFVRSTSIEQQAYITAAIGLCLEGMSKEELETTKDVLNSILEGVTCRLESADNIVRKMASSIALVFSRIIDPKNPLYLDDSCGEMVDWDFGLGGTSSVSLNEEPCNTDSQPSKIIGSVIDSNRHKDVGENMKRDDISIFKSEIVDPDEVIDPVVLLNDNCQADRGIDDSDDGRSENSEGSSDSSLQPYDLADDGADLQRKFSQLGDLIAALKKSDNADGVERALHVAEALIRASPDELQHSAGDLASTLVRIRCSDLTIDGEEESAEEKRQNALVALLVTCPFESLDSLNKLLYSPNLDVSQRFLIIDVMTHAAQELADTKTMRVRTPTRDLISPVSGKQPWFLPSSRGPPGIGPWKEVSETDSHLSWSHRYERELPSKSSQVKGKSRRWSLRTVGTQEHGAGWSKNKFPLYAAAFMLPSMQAFDIKRHGVDLLDRDFIVLGKLIYMLGVCMKCIAMHPEASALAPALLDMLSSRKVSHHPEAYVRRSVLFTASCILVAMHPSYVASALIEGNQDISKGLEWIRTWALYIAESDSDTECSSMAMKCLQLHAEMALQTSRTLESADCFKGRAGFAPLKMKEIIMPSLRKDPYM